MIICIMSHTEYISRAQEALTKIAEKCQDALDLESKIEMIDYEGSILYSGDLKSYHELIITFLENMMHVDVSVVISEGFLCDFTECEVKFFLGKKRVLALMIHLLQDIILFRNELRIREYMAMFSEIIKKEMGEEMKKRTRDDIKNLNTRINIANSSGDRVNILALRKSLKEKDLLVWTQAKKEAGINADRISVEIGGLSREQMISRILAGTSTVPESKDRVKILLNQIIYLRHLDNLCNQQAMIESGEPEEEIRRGSDNHTRWINVLEEAHGLL